MADALVDLSAASEEVLAAALDATSGRAARTLVSRGGLSQTLLALRTGAALAEHTAPGPATLVVLRGEVALGTDGDRSDVHEGRWIPVPTARHDLQAIQDSVVLLTVVTAG